MTYISLTVYTVECSHPRCHETVIDDFESHWLPSRADADERAEDMGWQVRITASGTRHYCPRHIHAVCALCGRRETGTARDLDRHGWQDPVTDYAACPRCARADDADHAEGTKGATNAAA